MKKIGLFLLFLFLAAPAHAVDLTTGLTAYWNLTESSGTRNDSTANALHLTASASSPTGVSSGGPGSQDVSLFASASSQFLSHGDTALLRVGDNNHSIGIWVRLATNAASQSFISKYDFGGGSRSLLMTYNQGTDRFRYTLSSDGSSGTRTDLDASTCGSPSTGTWYFVVGTYNATSDVMKISCNAGTQDSTSHAGGAFVESNPFYIGTQGAGGTESTFLDGRAAMAFLYSIELSTDQITALYNGGSGCSYAQLTTTCAGSSSTVLRRRGMTY